MAKSTKKKVSRIKIKKKTWHKVLAPAIFGRKEMQKLL
jgi:ribosomal protein S3AE